MVIVSQAMADKKNQLRAELLLQQQQQQQQDEQQQGEQQQGEQAQAALQGETNGHTGAPDTGAAAEAVVGNDGVSCPLRRLKLPLCFLSATGRTGYMAVAASAKNNAAAKTKMPAIFDLQSNQSSFK